MAAEQSRGGRARLRLASDEVVADESEVGSGADETADISGGDDQTDGGTADVVDATDESATAVTSTAAPAARAAHPSATAHEAALGPDPSGPIVATLVDVPERPLRSVRRSMRGLNPTDVDEVVEDLRSRLTQANRTIERYMSAPGAGRQLESLDEAETLAVVGYEGARIIRTSKERSASILGEARREFDRLLDEGNEYVRSARSEAEVLVAEAEARAAGIVEDAERRARESQEDSARESADARDEARRRLKEADDEAATVVAEARAKADALLAEADERADQVEAEIEEQLEAHRAELAEQARLQREQIEAERKEMLAESQERIAEMKVRYGQMLEAYEQQRSEMASELSYQRNLLVRYLKDADEVRSNFFEAYHGFGAAVETALRNLNAPMTKGRGLIGTVDEQIAVMRGVEPDETDA